MDESALNTKIEALETAIGNAEAAGVTSFGGKTGAITVKGGQKTNGAVNLAMSNNELQASIVGLGSAAYTNAAAYATAAQGTKADSAIQGVTGETALGNTDYIAVTATENETSHEVTLSSSLKIQAVAGASSTVKGLAEASDVKAYVDGKVDGKFDEAGAAAQALADAKDYTDSALEWVEFN